MRKFSLLLTIAIPVIFASCEKGGGNDTGGEEKPTPTDVRVTGVELDKEALTLYMDGAAGTLSATVAPADATNQKISWTSTKPDVASVDAQGTVTALKLGSAIIVVTTEDGEFTDECTVTVRAAQIHPTGVELDRSVLTLVKGQAVTLTATVAPSNADDKSCRWESSNPAAATVEGGIVTGRGTGTTVITVRTNDGDLTDECTVTMGEGVMLNTLIWAEHNVGAPGEFSSAPENMGMLYKWGQKTGWSSTEPLRNSNGGTTWDASSVNGETPWPMSDDPCPTGWRIPTLNELVWLTFWGLEGQSQTNNGAVEWTIDEVNGVLGVRFTSMTVPEASIFMPTDGYRWGAAGALAGKSDKSNMSGMSFYWVSDVLEGAPTEGHRLYLSRGKNSDGTLKMTVEPMAITLRQFAMGIRCVRSAE